MSFNAADLLTKLRATSGVTAIVGTYGTPSSAAIFYSVSVPKDYTGKAVNFYLVSPADCTLSYGDYVYSVNCRCQKQVDALLLQTAVINGINRSGPADGGCIFYCTALPVIRPADETDDYNAPIEVRIKSRRA